MQYKITWEGQEFDNELHARWAVFLTELSIQWEYNARTFLVDNNRFRMPNFILPTFDGGMLIMFAEAHHSRLAVDAYELSRYSGCGVWMVDDVPAVKAYEYYSAADLGLGRPFLSCGIPNADQAYRENRMYCSPGYEEENGTIPQDRWQELGDDYLSAVEVANTIDFSGESKP